MALCLEMTGPSAIHWSDQIGSSVIHRPEKIDPFVIHWPEETGLSVIHWPAMPLFSFLFWVLKTELRVWLIESIPLPRRPTSNTFLFLLSNIT